MSIEKLCGNGIYLSDIKNVVDVNGYISNLRGKSVLLTGATGLICSAVVDILHYCNEKYGCGNKIYVAGRNEKKAAERFGGYPDVEFVGYDAEKPITFSVKADYIISGASNAYPEVITKYPAETMNANFIGVLNLLEYVKIQRSGRIVYISSSEVYGKNSTAEPLSENEYGFVDLLNPRASYASSKRAAETLAASFLSEYGVDSVIVRPGHIYGPTASSADNRVSSAFANSAARAENIVMKSRGSQIRSYCHCLDCATAILCVMLNGVSGNAYNISNENSIISIKQMAEYVAEAGGVEVRFELPNDSETRAFNPMDNSSLNNDKLKSLGWNGALDAPTGLSHTVEIIKQIQ